MWAEFLSVLFTARPQDLMIHLFLGILICGGLFRTSTYTKIYTYARPIVGPVEPIYTKSQHSMYVSFVSHEYCVFNLLLVAKSPEYK